MRPTVLAVLLAVLAWEPALAETPRSRPISGWDGGTLGAGSAAIYAATGYPAVDAGFRVGVADALDLGVEGTWQYPRGWLEADVNARYLLWGRNRAALSAVGRFGLFRNAGLDDLNDDNAQDTGLVLGLGVHAGFGLGQELLTAAVDVPFAVGLKEGTTHLPLLLSLGLDHPLGSPGDSPASVGVGVQAGPWGVGGPGESFAYWALIVRVTHRL